MNRVRVFINPNSGMSSSIESVIMSVDRYWDGPDVDLAFQISHSVEDGQQKTRQALADNVDTIIVIGGDGMINSIGSELVGTQTALAVIPTGSGNGFARHFGIPLNPERAAQALAGADRLRIDVGVANGRPFFVTCSMAWDAAIVRTFEKSPVRGILPYVFSGVYEFFEYKRQAFDVIADAGPVVRYPDPFIFTVANLTQFGGQAVIAPTACPDDGMLELIVINRADAPRILGSLPRLFNGTIDKLNGVITTRFKHLQVKRTDAGPIQIDGELVEAPADVEVTLRERSLTVLVPSENMRVRNTRTKD